MIQSSLLVMAGCMAASDNVMLRCIEFVNSSSQDRRHHEFSASRSNTNIHVIHCVTKKHVTTKCSNILKGEIVLLALSEPRVGGLSLTDPSGVGYLQANNLQGGVISSRNVSRGIFSYQVMHSQSVALQAYSSRI